MTATGEQHPPRRRLAVLIGVAATVLAADVASKAAVVALLPGRPHVRLFGGQLTLVATRNPGAAFGIGGPTLTVAFTAIAAGVAVTIVRYSRHISSIRWAVALGLLLGGAMGNLTDRLFRFPGRCRAGWWTGSGSRTGPRSTSRMRRLPAGPCWSRCSRRGGTAALDVHPARGEADREPGPTPGPRLVPVPVKPGPGPVPGPAGPP